MAKISLHNTTYSAILAINAILMNLEEGFNEHFSLDKKQRNEFKGKKMQRVKQLDISTPAAECFYLEFSAMVGQPETVAMSGRIFPAQKQREGDSLANGWAVIDIDGTTYTVMFARYEIVKYYLSDIRLGKPKFLISVEAVIKYVSELKVRLESMHKLPICFCLLSIPKALLCRYNSGLHEAFEKLTENQQGIISNFFWFMEKTGRIQWAEEDEDRKPEPMTWGDLDKFLKAQGLEPTGLKSTGFVNSKKLMVAMKANERFVEIIA